MYVKEPLFTNKSQLSLLYFFKKKSNNTIVSLQTIINGYVNVKFYDSNDVVPLSLRKTPQNDFNSLTPLHIPT